MNTKRNVNVQGSAAVVMLVVLAALLLFLFLRAQGRTQSLLEKTGGPRK